MKKIASIFKVFLLLLFLSYWGEITFFTHFHVINGVTIKHSHPYKSGHTHSTSQLETIAILDNFKTTGESSFIQVPSAIPVLLVIFSTPLFIPLFCSRYRSNIHLRAPPIAIL